ncbi:MAG: hypothetical protein GF418_11290 [Chitinivibrionales bacterium]|nr:hypothetical protein [Chitinivibrionales bacterium]MBD3396199.1 hypothetical protein [Chitinivibrionales bacterium]
MDDMSRHLFEKLSDAGPVPDTIYPAVQKGIRRRKTFTRAVWAMAATVVLAAGITTFTSRNDTAAEREAAARAVQAEAEIEDELQTVHDFINAETIEDEVDRYALVDPSFF